MNQDNSNDKSKMDLAQVRSQYKIGSLSEADMAASPFVQFSDWYNDAEKACRYFTNSMTVSTVDDSGAPFSRVVLLKTLDDRGFVFFTNYNSRKAQQLQNNQAAAITIFWPELERQVNISGLSEEVSDEESDTYFATRPRGSQIGAWVSDQSAEIPDRDTLMQEQQRLEKTYQDKQIPRPPHWGGFRIVPTRIEFWQGQPDRLHDRMEYILNGGQWSFGRLAP